MGGVTLRRASSADAKLLYTWRNDPATRGNSLCHAPVLWETHLQWLETCLADSTRALYVAESSGEAVGTVRSDFDGKVYELSWTVAPDWRGRGLGLGMVRALIATLPLKSHYQAVVLHGNEASHRIALTLAMKVAERSDAGVVYRGRRTAS